MYLNKRADQGWKLPFRNIKLLVREILHVLKDEDMKISKIIFCCKGYVDYCCGKDGCLK